MQGLDDYFYFAKVIEHGGYARASRALGIPKSRLSRHMSALEQRLAVRLVNRSTRRFAVTEVGQEVYRHAQAMLTEAEAAQQAVELARAEPRGLLRVSCPIGLAHGALTALMPEFLVRYPQLRVLVHASNRRVDVINEGFDAAIRVRTHPSGEDGLVMRGFGETRELLVASPAYLERAGRPQHPRELAHHATLGFGPESERQDWELTGPSGELERVSVAPRLVIHDFAVIESAARAGLGIALLPEMVLREPMRRGELERVLPGWNLPLGILHMVFPTRRGMLPRVRAFIDFMAERLPGEL